MPTGSKLSPHTRRPENGLCLAKGQPCGFVRPARPCLRRRKNVAVHAARAGRQFRVAARGFGLAQPDAQAVRLARGGPAVVAPGCGMAAIDHNDLRGSIGHGVRRRLSIRECPGFLARTRGEYFGHARSFGHTDTRHPGDTRFGTGAGAGASRSDRTHAARYFQRQGLTDWVFACLAMSGEQTKNFEFFRASTVSIKRHTTGSQRCQPL